MVRGPPNQSRPILVHPTRARQTSCLKDTFECAQLRMSREGCPLTNNCRQGSFDPASEKTCPFRLLHD